MKPERPRFKLLQLVLSWLLTALAMWVAAAILPGVDVVEQGGALLMAAVVGVLNALLPPLLAALRLPFTVGLGFILALIMNALILLAGSELLERTYEVDNFGSALLRCSSPPSASSSRSSSARTTKTRTRCA